MPLRVQADSLLQRILAQAKQDAGAAPFAVAGGITWMLVMALLKVQFPQSMRLAR
jgi:hypothetical protein